MRITFRMPNCDDWTDEAIAALPDQERDVKVTHMLRWDQIIARAQIVAARRDGHDALVTVEVADDPATTERVVGYLHATTGRDEFSIPPGAAVETTGDGPEVPGACGFMRDPLRLFEVSVQTHPAVTTVPPPEQWRR